MNTGYEGILQFRGKWRDYQERVLLHAQQYLKDGKIHIVAAPGSGKTTLGIELIRRLGAPCLIFFTQHYHPPAMADAYTGGLLNRRGRSAGNIIQ